MKDIKQIMAVNPNEKALQEHIQREASDIKGYFKQLCNQR